MADYREISQEYAKQGINAAFILNGGAAVALLSQTTGLVEKGLTSATSTAMLLWAIGTAMAALTWVLAFASTRYVDKSEREHRLENRHLNMSNCYMHAGTAAVLVSMALFVGGCVALACQIRSL